MRKPGLNFSDVLKWLAVLAVAPLAAGGESLKPAETELQPLVIRIRKLKEWDASKPDIEKVLNSSASVLWRYFPGRKLEPIEVEPQGGPITLFQRGPNGEIRVKLATGGTLWAQYSFQFAHELGHVLCGYDTDEHRNKWFEESLCELASLFALRRMAEVWAKEPPYPNWKSYAPHLQEYAEERIVKAKLPAGTTLAKWYEDNAVVLAGNAVDRGRNTTVACTLLPIFEAAPEKWEAVAWLNTEKLTKLHTFQDYLEAWRKNCPEKHRDFVDQIAKQFGVALRELESK